MQMVIDVPLLEDFPERSRDFVRALFAMVSLPDGARTAIAKPLELDGNDPLAILAPFFGRARESSPRGLKASINRAAAELGALQAYDEVALRQAVARVFWPDSYRRLVMPALTGDHEAREHLSALLRIGRVSSVHVGTAGLDISEAILLRSCERQHLEFAPEDAVLILYLSRGDWSQLLPEDDPVSGWQQSQRASLEILGGSTLAGGVDRELRDLETQFQLEGLNGDSDAQMVVLRRVVEIVTGVDQIPRDLAATVGNMALRASEIKQADSALLLHQAAVKADPSHTNVLQNYADFLLDIASPRALEFARESISKLDSPERLGHRPGRSAVLRLRLAFLDDDQGERDVAVSRLLAVAMDANDVVEIASAVDALTRNRLLQEAEELVRSFVRAHGAGEESCVAMRVLADGVAVAGSGSDEFHRVAADLYEYLLASGAWDSKGDASNERLAGVLHNLATVVYAMDFDDYAGMIWSEAYPLAAEDHGIRHAFSAWIAANVAMRARCKRLHRANGSMTPLSVLWNPVNFRAGSPTEIIGGRLQSSRGLKLVSRP